MESTKRDIAIIRDLAKKYAEVCASERNEGNRKLWRAHNSMKPGRPLVVCSIFFATDVLHEIDPQLPPLQTEGVLREVEQWLQRRIWAATIPDDMVYEPYYPMRATMRRYGTGIFDCWGVAPNTVTDSSSHGYRFMPLIHDEAGLEMLKATKHEVLDDNPENVQQVREALGDILPVHVDRSGVYPVWMGTDLAMAAGAFLGLEELMYQLYENPGLVHALMRFMRDAVLANLEESEAAGDWSGINQCNYGMPPYAEGLAEPQPGQYGAKLKDLWFFTHAQEFEGVSPEQHEEFLLQYQMPIMAKFGLVNYGCCETLTHKIPMLRKIPNLRRILVGPTADLDRAVREIGRDYIISWRPNPSIVSSGFDETEVRQFVRSGLQSARGCQIEIMLKEVMTIQHDLSRLFRWTEIAQEEAAAV